MIVTNPFNALRMTRDQIRTVSRAWWVLLLAGIVGVVAGGIILFNEWTVGDLVTFVGALLLMRGFLTALSIPLDGSPRGWAVALGLLEVAVGVAVWVWPEPTLLVVALLIGWWVAFSGIVTIAGAIAGRSFLPYWGLNRHTMVGLFTLAFGIVETLLSIWLLARPDLTIVSTVLAIGVWTMVSGVVQIALSFELKYLARRIDEDAEREFERSAKAKAA